MPTPEQKLELPFIDFFARGGALKSSWYGDCLPERDFPMLIDLYRQGRLPLDAFVSEEIGIGDVEEAFDQDARRRRAAVRGGDEVSVRIERVVTSGTFSLDGGTWDVDNNVWLVGDDDEVLVIDAAHDAGAIAGRRRGTAGSPRSCARTGTTTTSGRPGLAEQAEAPIWLHPEDRMLWDVVAPRRRAGRRARRRAGVRRSAASR